MLEERRLDFAARSALRKARMAAVVAQVNTLGQRLGQRAAEVVGLVVVHQRAGVDAHPAVFFHHHFREMAHELAA